MKDGSSQREFSLSEIMVDEVRVAIGEDKREEQDKMIQERGRIGKRQGIPIIDSFCFVLLFFILFLVLFLF